MNIDFLHISNLRCFEDARFSPGPGINWLTGNNGVGKTTWLEAAHLLSHGRSFRAGGRSAPRRHGATSFLIHAGLARANGTTHKLGIVRQEDRWQARLDGVDLTTLAPLFATCPVVCFGPESPSLILGPAEERRSFLDWGVFHVEHESLVAWRMWRRALRQRNTLLQEGGRDSAFEPWEHELDRLGRQIQRMRSECLASFGPYIESESANLVPELGKPGIHLRAGWDESVGLSAQLAATRTRDRERGFTQYGAHRADWSLQFEQVARREHFSRGQAKAVALVCVLALARWLNDRLGEYPLLCLDDIHSELDQAHVLKVMVWLAGRPVQTWITSTEPPAGEILPDSTLLFHVEQTGPVPV